MCKFAKSYSSNKMKKIITLIIGIIFASYVFAEAPNDDSSQGIILEYTQYNEIGERHRAPMRLNIDAYFNATLGVIGISFNGETQAEVYLYLNGNLIGYDSQLNTTFPLPSEHGTYAIEIIGSSWRACGSINI